MSEHVNLEQIVADAGAGGGADGAGAVRSGAAVRALGEASESK